MRFAPRLPLAPAEGVALIAAIAIAHALYARIGVYPPGMDARNYLDIAADIARQGLFSPYYYSNIRTYGYPLFLRAMLGLARGNATLWPWLVFECQLVLYLAVALALRAEIALRSPAFARAAFCTLALNLYALSFAPETLSESLSMTLLLAAAGLWLRLRRSGVRVLPLVLVGSLVIGFAVMVRPANLFALAGWTIAVGLALYERRAARRVWAAAVLALAVGVATPMVPQLVNNVRYYDDPTPLVASHLERLQRIWGILYLKYATALPPVPSPSVFYDNPLAVDRPVDEAHPLRWYVEHPGPGMRTLALHVFNLTDPDLLFTYNRDLDPWYRIPLGIVTHALFAIALCSVVVLWRARTEPGVGITAAALLVLLLGFLAVHATAAVEVRFGLPLFVLVPALAVWTLRRWRRAGARHRVPLTLGVAAYVVAALALSTWVRAQAPAIRAWQEAQRVSPPVPSAPERREQAGIVRSPEPSPSR